jgi:hypothetical protein
MPQVQDRVTRLLLKAGRHLIGLISVPLGLLWESALSVSAIPLILILALLISIFTPLKFWIGVLISIVAIGLSLSAAPRMAPKLVRYRWRLFTKEIQLCALRRTDPPSSPFILYLRPFDADFSSSTQPPYETQNELDLIGYSDDGSPLLHGMSGGIRPVHLERYMRVALLPWGWMLAVSNPAEAQLESPYRLVTQDVDWREIVDYLCRHAQLIVCMVPLDQFEGPDPVYPWVPLENRKPAFSRDSSYAGFYEELRHLSVGRHCAKALLVIPGWQNTREKWAALKAKIGDTGFSLPEKPELPGTRRDSGLGLFQFHPSGEHRFHYWMREIPEQGAWNAMVWLSTARFFAAMLGKKIRLPGVMVGVSEYRWLLGPSTGEILHAVRRMTNRRNQSKS